MSLKFKVVMVKRAVLILILVSALVAISPVGAQLPVSADVAAYQLGLVAEALPGSSLTYTITVTNYGPSVVQSFYILDGWSVDDEGISGFAAPIVDPDFGSFALVGAWQQDREDQEVLAWLLEGELAPGDTIQFDWTVRVDSAYQGILVNWARILTDGELEGTWQARPSTAITTPPPVESAVDLNPDNNRTTDGVTVVTPTPRGEGIDLALYQTGVLTTMAAGHPLASTWLVANHGPQPIRQFYLVAGWSLNTDGGSLLAQPVVDPDFGSFQVMGRWKQLRQDEEVWLWLLQGELLPGESVVFQWERGVVPDYRGDLINWAGLSVRDVPEGEWAAREGTTTLPQPLVNLADTFPGDNRSIDALTTING